MSLSEHLQAEDVLAATRGKGPEVLRRAILERGGRWYREHPDEGEVIQKNLEAFGISADADAVDEVKTHILLHYFEKLIPLISTPHEYRAYLDSAVDAESGIQRIVDLRNGGKGILLAASHFGAVELIAPVLAAHRLPITAALRYKTEHLSAMARRQAQAFEQSGCFGPIRIIEVGKSGTQAAMEMAAAVRRGDILISVFDERTEYSIPVDLFGTKVWGGAGLDRLIRFSGKSIALCAGYMIRGPEQQYRFEIEEVSPDEPDPIQALYHRQQHMVEKHPEQWYFLHEEIPFVS